MMDITKMQRTALLSKIEMTVTEKYYDPAFDNQKWQAIVARHTSPIVDTPDTEGFEKAVTAMLNELSPRTLGLLSDRTPVTSRNAIGASFSVQPLFQELRWVFQDVLPGGVAAKAGVRSGDVLLKVADQPMKPLAASAGEPPFGMHQSIAITVLRGKSGEEVSLTLSTGTPRYKDNPYSDLTALKADSLDGTAYLRVSLFPGKIGIDFANELDQLFHDRFASAERLIIDLRGNPGGGIGGLALMSYLTPDRLPVGYSRNRKMAQKREHPSSLPVFDKVPRSKLAIPGLALKFMGKTSVFLYTEALGNRSYQGQTAVLVNEHTTGAAEMIAQFAQENKLALIVGSKTPGRLVSRTATKLGYGYRLIVPVAAYISAKGTQIQGKGIVPDIDVSWSFTDATNGKDNQLEAAVQSLREPKTPHLRSMMVR